MVRIAPLLELQAVAHAGVVCGSEAETFARLLEAVFDAPALTLGSDSPAGHSHRSTAPPSWVSGYWRYAHQDPSEAYLARHPPGTPFFVHQTKPEPSFRELQELFTASGFRDAMVVRFAAPPHCRTMLIAYRLLAQSDFDDEDRRALSLLYPHLASVLTRHRTSWALHAPSNQTREEALAALDCVMLVHPDSGRVHGSARAYRHLAEHHGIVSESERSRFDRMLLSAAATPPSQQAGPLVLFGKVAVECFPHTEPNSYVVVVDEPFGPLAPSAFSHAVTPAESALSARQLRVARLAAQGLSSSRIAAELGLGFETVRTHLKSIYEKLGIRTRGELSRLISSAPARQAGPPPIGG